MMYVGVDVGKRRHAVAILNSEEKIVLSPRFFTQDAGGFASLRGELCKLGSPEDFIIGLEATGHYWRVLRHDLEQYGYRVDVFNPLLSSREASADIRGRKTDKLDALCIARVVRGGRYNAAPASDPSLDGLKSLTRQRSYLVGQRSDCKRRLRAVLDVIFPEAAKLMQDPFSVSSQALLREFPSARLIAKADIRKLSRIMVRSSGGQRTSDDAKALKNAARKSIAITILNEADEFIATQLIDLIAVYKQQIEAIEAKILSEPVPAVAACLRSIAGSGKIMPMIIAAELGDIRRFEGHNMSRSILAYAGCEPRIRESGNWKGKAKMSKRGSPQLRTTLFLMAGTIRLHTRQFNEVYKAQTSKGKHHKVAVSHVMRKIIEVMCGMHKTQTTYIHPPIESVAC